MKLNRLRMIMLALAVAGPLASSTALASGNGENLLSLWNQWTQWFQGHHGPQGPVRNLPGPGMLGLVVIGLGTGLTLARRRK